MNKPTFDVAPGSSPLMVIDPQLAFGTVIPVPDVEAALDNMRVVAEAWRKAGGKVMITAQVYHWPHEVGQLGKFIPGIEQVLQDKHFKPIAPGTFRDPKDQAYFHPGICDEMADEIIRKTRFNALVGTNLELRLRELRPQSVVVCGLTTPICVQATVDGLNMAGFDVVVLSDACASQPMEGLSAQEAHKAAIERMRYLFAEVITTNELLKRIQ